MAEHGDDMRFGVEDFMEGLKEQGEVIMDVVVQDDGNEEHGVEDERRADADEGEKVKLGWSVLAGSGHVQ
jgi:hypothetical protein